MRLQSWIVKLKMQGLEEQALQLGSLLSNIHQMLNVKVNRLRLISRFLFLQNLTGLK